MAEMVRSAVVQEAVNQVISGVIKNYEGTSTAKELMERLEKAHIKLEAALEASEKWHITNPWLLRWKKKLKHAAQECDETLHKCRQHLHEQEVRNSSNSFPKRIAHATKSLISSIFHSNSNWCSKSDVRRFEWFADGASEFLRFMELGGTPLCYTFFDPLIRHLLKGKTIDYKSVRGSKHHVFYVRPFKITEHRTEARLFYVYRDDSAPEDNLFLALMLQLSESTDIVGTAVKCLELFTPHFKTTAEIVKKELTQLPTQDFSWLQYDYSCHAEHWENIHSIHTQWLRPNPLCCKQSNLLHKSCGNNNMDMLQLSDASLEPVVSVFLEHHITLSEYDKQGAIHRKRSSPKEYPLLKLGLVFMPHSSSKDNLPPAVESSVTQVINGEEQDSLYRNITLEQLDNIMLSKAIDCLHHNTEATAYQMLWKSKHGSAYLHIAKKSMQITTKRRTISGGRNGMLLQLQDQEMESRRDEIRAFLNLWAAHAPVRLQTSIMEWIQEEKEKQLESKCDIIGNMVMF